MQYFINLRSRSSVFEDALVEKNNKIENHGSLESELSTVKDAKKKAEDSLAAASKALDAISDDVKKEEGIDNKIKKIKEVFDKIPAGVSAPNPKSEDVDPYSDCRKDPVNNYFDE